MRGRSTEGAAAFVAWMTGEPTPDPDPDPVPTGEMFARVIAEHLGDTAPAPTTTAIPALDPLARLLGINENEENDR